MKRNHKEIERAKALEKHKKDLKNKIGKIELSYLCRLGLLYFEIKPKHKPTFVDMVVFSRTKPTKLQMIRWLKKYNDVLIVKK